MAYMLAVGWNNGQKGSRRTEDAFIALPTDRLKEKILGPCLFDACPLKKPFVLCSPLP